MELRQVRYFAAICQEGSLTRAGARLHLAQQSLSQTVAALEAELGVALLDRGPFGVRPTAAGRVLRDRGAALLAEADAVARAVRLAGSSGGAAVTMRYGLDSEHHVVPLLARWREVLPDVAVHGFTGSDADNLRALGEGDVDLVLAWAVEGRAAGLHARTVATETCLAAVPDGHPLAGRPTVPVEALAGCTVVVFPRRGAPHVWDHITEHLTAPGRTAPRLVETAVSGQGGMVDDALRRGAVTTVSAGLVPSLARPGVRFVPFAPDVTVPLQLVWRPGSSPAAGRVIAALDGPRRSGVAG
ncbi:MAG TPA: LysR family transcriptional regulator [Pseudonocardia sp.]